MKTIKKLIYFFPFLLLLVCCTDTNEIIDNMSSEVVNRYANPYDVIGEQHNVLLDSVYTKLKRAWDNNEINERIDSDSLFDIIISYVYDFNEEMFDPSDLSFFDSLSTVILDEQTELYDPNVLVDQLDKFSNPSIEFIDLINEIDAIIEDDTLTYKEYQSKLDDLIVDARNLSLSMERNLSYASISIASHSGEYWYYNYDDWSNLFEDISGFANPEDEVVIRNLWPLLCGSKCINIVKEDIAYGVAGGLVGAVIGGSVSFGALTLPGWAVGAIGGAGGASIGRGIRYLLDAWF